ncbi:HAD-IA family hydrolase [Jannaschia sp. W003]|uniref:HAD-IA family hydrolase n=1 Tax=Jannaschia sp. W003 TaxID=2867012 RepID=UPI0021A3DB02|nr:HAD-IA family hydrolase [Jannaschia sp. W003]UWQ21348.1 HAD-IA family hydrolase [Jannaschia sp. W003]
MAIGALIFGSIGALAETDALERRAFAEAGGGAPGAARFGALVAAEGLRPRPGIVETIGAARRRGLPVALCSTAPAPVVAAVVGALAPVVLRADFAWVGDATRAARPRPAPDALCLALAVLDVPPATAVAVEDSAPCAEAALAAGCRVLGFPGGGAAAADFPPGLLVVDRLQPRLLDLLAGFSTAAE